MSDTHATTSLDVPPKSIAQIGRGKPVIAARRLALWYGEVIGINDVSLDIGAGVVGLLGPNGAGKSTLLKVISGQLRPSTGSVSVFGHKLWNNPQAFSQIGLVPEQDAFYEDMTGRQFVTYLTQLQGFSRHDAQQLADKAIETVNLEKERDRRINEYSKGMRQRIKIAQALAHNPSVVFMDEPLSGTDPVGRRHIIDLIRSMGKDGKTVVVSSHILHEVEQITEDILLINKGRIVADGNIYDIRAMIDAHPHTIDIGCDNPREFAALLAKYDDIMRIDFVTDGLRVATRTPDACYDRIVELSLNHNIELYRMTSLDNNLTALFKYLISPQQTS